MSSLVVVVIQESMPLHFRPHATTSSWAAIPDTVLASVFDYGQSALLMRLISKRWCAVASASLVLCSKDVDGEPLLLGDDGQTSLGAALVRASNAQHCVALNRATRALSVIRAAPPMLLASEFAASVAAANVATQEEETQTQPRPLKRRRMSTVFGDVWVRGEGEGAPNRGVANY